MNGEDFMVDELSSKTVQDVQNHVAECGASAVPRAKGKGTWSEVLNYCTPSQSQLFENAKQPKYRQTLFPSGHKNRLNELLIERFYYRAAT